MCVSRYVLAETPCVVKNLEACLPEVALTGTFAEEAEGSWSQHVQGQYRKVAEE